MDVVALGASTVLGTWGFGILQKILLECKGVLEVVESSEPLSADEKRDGTNRLLISRNPKQALFELLLTDTLPVIAFIDHPVDSIRSVKQLNDCGTVEAIRSVTETAAAARTLERSRRILVVDRDFGGGDARRVVAGMAAYLLGYYEGHGLEEFLAREDVAASAEDSVPMELELRNQVPHYLPAEESRRKLSAEDIETIQSTLGEMTIWPGRAVSTRWPRTVFLQGDEPSVPTGAITEVAGVARALYYGPYFYLPASRYKVRVTLGFSADTAHTTFTLTGWDGELLGSARVKPTAAGIFVATFDIDVPRPYRPVELRISNDVTAIEGKIALVEVELVEWAIDAERERQPALPGEKRTVP